MYNIEKITRPYPDTKDVGAFGLARSKYKCFVCINGEHIEYSDIGEFFDTSEAPDYGCASFEFEIDNMRFSKMSRKFKLSEEEEKMIRNIVANNWWGSSCAMCQ